MTDIAEVLVCISQFATVSSKLAIYILIIAQVRSRLKSVGYSGGLREGLSVEGVSRHRPEPPCWSDP